MRVASAWGPASGAISSSRNDDSCPFQMTAAWGHLASRLRFERIASWDGAEQAISSSPPGVGEGLASVLLESPETRNHTMSHTRGANRIQPIAAFPARHPHVVGPRALLSIFLAWAGALATAFLLGMKLA